MGGTLEVASVVGQGSTFWVELPLPQPTSERPTAAEMPPAKTQPERQHPAMTVLYIEDNLSNLQLVDRLLSRRPGVTLISAMRPQLGLDLAGEHHPDLILLDLDLPDMPGQEVLRRLRADPDTAHVPIVILSADARPALIDRLLEEGAKAFLTKPLDIKNCSPCWTASQPNNTKQAHRPPAPRHRSPPPTQPCFGAARPAHRLRTPRSTQST